MRLVIEATASCRTVRTGIARYTVKLVDALLELSAKHTHDEIRLGYRLSRWRARNLCHRPLGIRRIWSAGPYWPISPKVELVHGTDARVPAWRGVIGVATVHDLAVHTFPQISSTRFAEKKRKELNRLMAHCDTIIAVSETTRQDLLRFFDFPQERVEVVWCGVDETYRPASKEAIDSVLQRYALTSPYLLYVGEISVRKNIERLVRAYASTPLYRDFLLVLAGPLSYGCDGLPSLVSMLGMGRRVRLLGFVSDIDLPALYSGASAFLFPTLYEGFGLPVLEAMACGVPVVGGLHGAVREISGNHAVLVNPDDPHDIAAGIEAALGLKSEARQAAREYAATLTWQACAKRTRAVYERALAMR